MSDVRLLEVADELRRLTTLRPLSELTEADGLVLLWDEEEEDGDRWCSLGHVRCGGIVCDDKLVTPVAWTPLPKVRP